MQADTESQFINDDSDFDPTESPAPNKLTDSVNEFFSSAKIAFRNDGIHALKEPTIGAAVGALAMVIIIIIASLSFLMINSASNNDQEGGDNVVIDDESNEPLESWEMQATTRSGFDLPIDECQAFSFGGEQQEIRRIYYRRNSSEPDWWENRTYNEAGEMLTECKVYPDKNVAGEFYEKTYNVWEHSTITRMDNARANSNGEPGISSWTNYSYSIDDNGNVLNSTYYSSMAGEEIVFFHKIYDGDLLIQTNYSPFGDGVNIENYTYDESGLLTSSEFYYEELGGDYKGHGYTNTSFNDDGLKIKEETYYWDFAEGEIDEQIDIYNITRAASGEIISREYYSKSLWDDGDSDAVESEAWDNYSYDLVDGGYWHNSTQDNNCEHELYMYNGEENFQSDQIFEEKNDCEGNKTSEWSKTLDDEGNLLQLVGHYAIGTNNSYRTWTNHTYDDEGNELSKLYETSEAGSVNYREYTYDSNGNMLSSAYYRNWNESIGGWDGFYSKYEYVWSEFGVDGSIDIFLNTPTDNEQNISTDIGDNSTTTEDNGTTEETGTENGNETGNETVEEPIIRSGFHYPLGYCEPTTLGGGPHEVQELYYRSGSETPRKLTNRTWNQDGELLIECVWDNTKIVDGTFYSKFINTYQDGNKIKESYLRANTDGTPGYKSWVNKSWEYDIDGNMIVINENNDEFGIPERTTMNNWENGLLIQTISNINSTEPTYYNYSYDSTGYIISYTNSWIDENGDRFEYYNSTYVRDSEGHQLEYLYHGTIGNNTSRSESFLNKTYEQVAGGYWDNNTVGSSTHFMYKTTPGGGGVVIFQETRNSTGDITSLFYANYDSEWHILSITMNVSEIGSSPAYDETTVFDYDSQLNLLTIITNRTGIGQYSFTVFTYDSEGNMLSEIDEPVWDDSIGDWNDFDRKYLHIVA